jgi:hypothetical protein
MSRNPRAVKCRLECRRCGYTIGMCVPVRRGVPGFLRCDHDSHGGVPKDASGGMLCEECRCLWRVDGDDLTKMAEDALSSDMREWKRQGAVTLACG